MDKGTFQVSTPLVTGGALGTSGGGGSGGSGSTAGGGTGSTAGGGSGSTAGGGTTSTAGGGTGLDSGNGARISESSEPSLLLEEPDADEESTISGPLCAPKAALGALLLAKDPDPDLLV